MVLQSYGEEPAACVDIVESVKKSGSQARRGTKLRTTSTSSSGLKKEQATARNDCLNGSRDETAASAGKK